MKLTKKRSGASSVLILITVVILITLGFFTVISASVNYSQSIKSNKWTRSYYELDSSGEALTAKIDDELFAAEQQAVHYVLTSEYLHNDSKFIPPSIHEINKTVYNNDINNVYKVLNNTYKSLAVQRLKELKNRFGGTITTIYNKDGSIYALYYSNTLTNLKDSTYKLEVRLAIQDILYDLFIENGVVSGKKIDFKSRYLVTKWQQVTVETKW